MIRELNMTRAHSRPWKQALFTDLAEDGNASFVWPCSALVQITSHYSLQPSTVRTTAQLLAHQFPFWPKSDSLIGLQKIQIIPEVWFMYLIQVFTVFEALFLPWGYRGNEKSFVLLGLTCQWGEIDNKPVNKYQLALQYHAEYQNIEMWWITKWLF